MNTPHAGLPGALLVPSSPETAVASLPADGTVESPAFESLLTESTRPSSLPTSEPSRAETDPVTGRQFAESTEARLPMRLIRSLIESGSLADGPASFADEPVPLKADVAAIDPDRPVAEGPPFVPQVESSSKRPVVVVTPEMDWAYVTVTGTDEVVAVDPSTLTERELTDGVVIELQAAGLLPAGAVVPPAAPVPMPVTPEPRLDGEPAAGEALRTAPVRMTQSTAGLAVEESDRNSVAPTRVVTSETMVAAEGHPAGDPAISSVETPEETTLKGRQPIGSESPETRPENGGKQRTTELGTEPHRKPAGELPGPGAPVREARTTEGEPGLQREMRRFEPVDFRETTSDLSRAETAVAARLAANISNRYRMADAGSVVRTPREGSGMGGSGISAAKSGEAMKNKPRENQIAGPRLQNLPVGDRDGLVEAPTSASRPTGEGISDRSSRFANPAGEVVSMAMGASRGTSVVHGSGETPALSSAPVKTGEQLLLNLTREVMQFKKVNAESMAVVLKPDGHTEIFLHLATRNGTVEVQARFERGDFSALNSQWGQLQQTMQQQGVKLGDLHENFQRQHQQQQNQPDGGDPAWGHGQPQHQKPGRDAREDSFIERLDEKLIFGATTASANRPARKGASVAPARGSLEAWA